MQTANTTFSDGSLKDDLSHEAWWINLGGIDYPARTLYLPNWGWSNISVESLNEKVMNKEGYDYSSPEACGIDELFRFYVPDSVIYGNEDELIEFTMKTI